VTENGKVQAPNYSRKSLMELPEAAKELEVLEAAVNPMALKDCP